MTRTGHDRGLASGRIYKKLRMLFGQWENFTSHERMKASFRRWCIVSTLLPDLAAQRVKKAGRGTPYVEEMPRNRLRWPRLDVAMHLNIRSKGGNDAIQPSYMAPTPRGTRISEAMKAFASADSGERFDMGPPFRSRPADLHPKSTSLADAVTAARGPQRCYVGGCGG